MLRAGDYRGRIGMAHHTGGSMSGRALRGLHAQHAVGRAFAQAGMGGAVRGLGASLSASAEGSDDTDWAGIISAAGGAASSIITAFDGRGGGGGGDGSSPDTYYQQQLAQQQAQMQAFMQQQQQLMLAQQQQQQNQSRSSETDWKPWLIGGGLVVGGLVVLKVLKVI